MNTEPNISKGIIMGKVASFNGDVLSIKNKSGTFNIDMVNTRLNRTLETHLKPGMFIYVECSLTPKGIQFQDNDILRFF